MRYARSQVTLRSPNSWFAGASSTCCVLPATFTGPLTSASCWVSAAIPALYVASESTCSTSSICRAVAPAAPLAVIASATEIENGESARFPFPFPTRPQRSAANAPTAEATPSTAEASPALRATSALTRWSPIPRPVASWAPQAVSSGVATPAAPSACRV